MAASADGTGIEGCLLARFDGVVPPPWLLRWLDDGLAGVLLFAANLGSPEQTRSLVSQGRTKRLMSIAGECTRLHRLWQQLLPCAG
jgi:hypothetical protein